MNVSDLSDEELLTMLNAPEDSLAKQRARGPKKPAHGAGPAAHMSDEELLAALGKAPDASLATATIPQDEIKVTKPAYSLPDYAGENKAGPLSQDTQDADTADRAEANAVLVAGGGERDLADGGTQAQRRYIADYQRKKQAEDAGTDFAHFALGSLIPGSVASGLRRAGLGNGAANVVGGAAGGAVPAMAAGGTPREVVANAALGGVMGGAAGARPAEAARAPRTQAEIDAAVLQKADPEALEIPVLAHPVRTVRRLFHPDPVVNHAMEGSHETHRLAQEANEVLDRAQAPRVFRRDQLDAEVKNRAISDRARAGNVERDWRAALEDAEVQNRKSLDAPEAAVIAAGPVDTLGHRGMLKAVADETMGPAGSILPKVARTVEDARAQMERPVIGADGKPIIGDHGEPVMETAADPRVMILQREKLNQEAYRHAAEKADLEARRLRNAARIVSDVTAPEGSPYRAALDAYGKRKDYLAEVSDTLGPEGSLDPYRNPNAPDPRAAELEAARAEVDNIDALRGAPGSRVQKLAGAGAADMDSNPGAHVAESEIAQLQQTEPAANSLIDMIRVNNTLGRRGFKVPYLSPYRPTASLVNGVRQNFSNLRFKLNPPEINAAGQVRARGPREQRINVLPLELQLLMQGEDRR